MITSHNFAVRTSAAVDVLIYCWSTLRVADVSPSAAHHVVRLALLILLPHPDSLLDGLLGINTGSTSRSSPLDGLLASNTGSCSTLHQTTAVVNRARCRWPSELVVNSHWVSYVYNTFDITPELKKMGQLLFLVVILSLVTSDVALSLTYSSPMWYCVYSDMDYWAHYFIITWSHLLFNLAFVLSSIPLLTA